MASKKRSKALASSSSSFDRSKFISVKVIERYNNLVIHKPSIPERGFDNCMTKQIGRRNWEVFARQPRPALIPVVREFYSNAKEHRDFRVFVRGKWIPIDTTSINRFYNLSNIDNDEYSRLREDDVDPDEIIRVLAKSGTTWKRSKTGILNFPASGMTAGCKAWRHFIFDKLIPSSNLSEVTKERVTLNYDIQCRLSIDVGKVIYNIMRTLRGSTIGSLVHPSLIHELCLKGGVVTYPSEEIVHPKSAITRAQTWKFMSRSKSTSAPPPA